MTSFSLTFTSPLLPSSSTKPKRSVLVAAAQTTAPAESTASVDADRLEPRVELKDGFFILKEKFRKGINPQEKVKIEREPMKLFMENGIEELAKKSMEELDSEKSSKDDIDVRLKWLGLFHRRKHQYGKFMMRLKLPNGVTTSAQTRYLASVIRKYGEDGCADVTTRQNWQIRGVVLPDVPEILKGLASVGLTSLQSGMDNVRNPVGNPIAGIDPEEIVDTRPYTNLLSQFITANSQGNPDFTNLPRKWNVCVVGTHDLYEHPHINDLAYMPANKDGRFGFNLLVGGFFSPKRCEEAIPLDAWVPADDVLPLCKAVLEAYRDLGTRGNRQKTRMMWLIDELGVEGFRTEVEKRMPNGKLERGSSEDLVNKQWERRDYFGVNPQKQEGLSFVGLHVPVGRLQADDMDELARLADTYGSGELRLTVEQNIIIPNVETSKTEALLQEPFLKNRFSPEPSILMKGLVACTGSQFCGQAIIETKLRALKVTEEVERLVSVPRPIRMHWTGCPNTCGQVQVADIGFMGCLTRGEEGKPVEGADVYVGGRIGSDSHIGEIYKKGVRVTELVPLVAEILLKADLRRRERENTLLQKDISDLQKQVTILLKECRDVQLRCGAARDDDEDDYPLLSDVEMEMESEADKIISEHLLKFKDINGLVEQNVKLRNLVRSLSEQIESRETELKETFEVDLKNKTDEASAKVATVLKRAEEQGQMIESLHTSVAMYKRLYEEEQKLHSSDSRSSDLSPAVVPGRKNFLHLLEDSEEATKRAQEKAFERIRILEEDFAKARSEVIAIRSERDKLAMEANFAREKLEGIMKESERKREEMNSVLARNIEFSQLIIDHQRKLRESSESLHAAEEISRKLSMEVSVLKQEKELLSNAEKRASDEVSALSQRVYRLQATLDTVQSTEEVREETRAAERRKQEEHIKQLQREWAEAKKELQEERSNARDFTSDRNQTLNNAVMQVEEMGKELANALKAVSVAESRASVAEARLSDLEKKIRSSDPKTLDMDSGGIVSLSDKEMSIELRTAKEEIEKLRGEVESSKSHMLQYKSIAQVNETALKQMESAHENFRLEAEKRQRSLEAELVSLRERVSELENDCIQKSEQLATAAAGKEDALLSASAEIASLREENLVKKSQIEAMNIQMSTLKNDLETEHEKWRVAQRNYERQVILLSETIQELTKTSQALAALQEEASELRKLADARGIENSELNAKWSEEKLMLEQQKNLAEKKYHELNEQNKLLHSRLEAKHLNSAEKNSRSGTISSGSTDSDHLEDSGLQRVVHYLRRTKEIAETEISLMRQEKLRLQSQLESALKMAESARGSLTAERASTRASLLTDDGIKSLQLQVSEMNLLRESNMQLREENKHNFEKCQEMREVAQKARMESENFENLLKTKQTELDLCMKEMEKLRMETDLHKKRVDELRETYRNIDIADYNRLKDEVRQLEEKLKAKDAHAEDCKKVLLEKQNKISLLEKELTNCKKDLSEREKRLDDAQQAQATMQSEFNKQKQELEKNKKIHYTLNMTKRKYEKEKDELSKQNQSLAKQLEEAKEEAGKRTTTDAVVEQSVKEREEKEKRIQILDKYVHQLKDEVRKKTEDLKKKDEELTKERSERKSVEKEVGDSLTKIKKEKTKVDEELAKLERYQTALTHLSEELEKLKHADGNLPEGTSAVQVLSGSILNDQAAAYVSAVEYFERVARSIASNSQVSTKPTDMVTEPSSGIPAAEPSTMTRVPSSTPLIKSPVATTQQLPKVASDNKEKRLISQKPSTEFRRPSGRRIVRPQLVKPEESPKVDVDMPEAEGTGDEGKQPAAHEPESQVTTSVRPVQTLVRKRQADSLVSEPQQDSLTQGETSSEIAPPASKKAKGSESHPDTSEGENLAKEPAIDELMDATTTTDGDNEETEAENAEEKTEEYVEAQQDNEADEPVEESPTETETIPTEEESRDQTEEENQEPLTDMESDKEEGELDLDTLEDLEEGTDVASMMRSPEKEEVQPETLATPTQSPSRMETAMEEAETTIETPVEDDKTDEGGDAAEEAADIPNNANDQQEAPETDIKPETSAATTSPVSTAPTTSSTLASAITSSGAPETEDPKRAPSPGGGSSTIVTLADRAQMKRRERIANIVVSRAPNPATRGARGRTVNLRGGGRLLPRGGRAPRGGRGQSPSPP